MLLMVWLDSHSTAVLWFSDGVRRHVKLICLLTPTTWLSYIARIITSQFNQDAKLIKGLLLFAILSLRHRATPHLRSILNKESPPLMPHVSMRVARRVSCLTLMSVISCDRYATSSSINLFQVIILILLPVIMYYW